VHPESHDVVVVGGGPAGSATAAHLAGAGVDVAVLDRARFPRPKACAEYGSPETVRELDRLGVLPALEAHGTTWLTGTSVTAAGGNRMTGRFADAGGSPFRNTGLALPRRLLDAELVAVAAGGGATVHEGVRLRAVSHRRDGRLALSLDTEAGRREVSCRVLVGADGLRSRVARELGLRSQGGLRRVAFVVHVDGISEMGPAAEMHVARRGYIGLNPIDACTTNLALVVPADEARFARGDAAGFLRQRLGDFPELVRRIDLRRGVDRVMVTGPFDARCRRSVADGTLLVGDAAEFFDPFTGEGILTALVGARLASTAVVAALADGGPVRAARLAGYRHARRRAFLGKWLLERAIGYALDQPALFDRVVGRLERRGMGSTMVGVTGGFLPHSRILNPLALARMVG
jgi:flavin-dependent dehydrogenase